MLYEIKTLIQKMKDLSNCSSNIALAKHLGVSYNTLNTWIKRGKIPQEILLSFCIRNNCSLDYLLLEKEDNKHPTLFKLDNSAPQSYYMDKREKVTFLGEYQQLNIKPGDTIIVNKGIRYSPAYYLLIKNRIYFISKVSLNPFLNSALIIDYEIKITLEEFNKINLGIIEKTLEDLA